MFDVSTKTHPTTAKELDILFKNSTNGAQIKKKQKRPYASVVGFCTRRSTLNALLPDRSMEQSKSLKYYAEIGKAIETKVLDDYNKSGNLIKKDYKLPKELMDNFNIGGIIDCFLMVNGEPALVDIKTISVVKNVTFANLTRKQIEEINDTGNTIVSKDQVKTTKSKKPPLHNIAQVQIYAAITGITNAWLQFFSRRVNDEFDINDSAPSVKSVVVETTDDILSQRIAMILYTQKCIKAGVISDIPKQIRNITMCRNSFCEFTDFCWKDSILPIDIPLIDDKVTHQWKKECYEQAEEYISKKDERKKKTLELIGVL